MEELELSIMWRGSDPDGSHLRSLLESFEARHRCRVHVTVFSWETGWADLVKIALYKTGVADVSEVGANWVGNLVAMNALRSFREADLAAIGGSAAFFPAAWRSAMLVGDPQVWAVPWLADTRLVYYRRNVLEKAGIDENTAFQTPTQFERTLQRLQASGVAVPWVTPTQSARRTLHSLASWVWGAGGDFISTDSRHALVGEAEARAGLRAYFGLHRYLALAARHLDSSQSDALFQQGEAAVTISGPWLLLPLLDQPPAGSDVGLALPPGPLFVGGSNLVVWQHTRRERLAVELVRFLASQPVQAAYSQQVGLLPVRLDVLNAPPFTDHAFYQVMAQGLRTGRAFPSFALWGLVEDKLTAALTQLWADVLADPGLDLDATIAERFEWLAQQLDWLLSQVG